MAILDVQHIEKSFGSTKVLRDINFSLAEGQVLAIIGSSGSGKTTLLRCLNFLETPDKGTISVRDEVLFDAADPATQREGEIRRKRLHFGLVFQNFNLFPQYTALENVTLARELMAKGEKTGEDPAAIRAEEERLLAQMGLKDRMGNYPHQLSGGQQQRVAIARALAMRPDILCFDEPTSALDPELTGEVLRVIRGLADQHTTMIIVTHEMSFARDVADQVIFMDGGVVVEEGTPEAVFGNPQQERTRQFWRNTGGLTGKNSLWLDQRRFLRDTKRRERLERRSLLFLSVQNSTVYTGPRSTGPATDSRLSCRPWVTVVTSKGPPGWRRGQVWRPSRLRRACQAAAAAPPAAHRRGWVRAASWAVHRAVSRVWARKSQTSRPAAGRSVSWARAWRAGVKAASEGSAPPFCSAHATPGKRRRSPRSPWPGCTWGRGKSRVAWPVRGLTWAGRASGHPSPSTGTLRSRRISRATAKAKAAWRRTSPPQKAAAVSTRTTPPWVGAVRKATWRGASSRMASSRRVRSAYASRGTGVWTRRRASPAGSIS